MSKFLWISVAKHILILKISGRNIIKYCDWLRASVQHEKVCFVFLYIDAITVTLLALFNHTLYFVPDIIFCFI
jgi:hypothetical protein